MPSSALAMWCLPVAPPWLSGHGTWSSPALRWPRGVTRTEALKWATQAVGWRERQALPRCLPHEDSHGSEGLGSQERDGCPEQEPLSLSGGLGVQPEGGSSPAASSRDLGQTPLAGEVFGVKDKWIAYHVWQMQPSRSKVLQH